MSIFVRNKEETTCEKIIEQYSDTVYKVALSTMKNEADAQDIFQEVFLRYVKSKKHFESVEHGKAWFIRVTLNCCNTMFASKGKKETHLCDFEAVATDEKPTGILYFVNELDESYRIIIHLFYYEQYSVREISKILKESESTVKTRLFRARAMLKQRWEDETNA